MAEVVPELEVTDSQSPLLEAETLKEVAVAALLHLEIEKSVVRRAFHGCCRQHFQNNRHGLRAIVRLIGSYDESWVPSHRPACRRSAKPRTAGNRVGHGLPARQNLP